MSDLQGLTSPEKKTKSWRKSVSTESITKSIEVSEIQFKNKEGKLEPAFLVCYYSSDSLGEKYESNEKKICMLENPLSDVDEDKEDESEKIKNDYKGWFDNPMMEG